MSITALIVLSVYLLGLLMGFFAHPSFAFLSYMWIFYNHPPAYWWGADLPDFRYSLIAAIVAFVAALRFRNPDLAPWYGEGGAKVVAFYALWMWCQTPWSIHTLAHLEGTILATKYVMLFYLIYKVASEEKRIDAIFWAHIVGCFLFGWVAFNTDVRGRLETLGGPGVDDSNLLAAHMITGVVIAGFLFMRFRDYRRWIAFITIPFILNAIILTQSRGGFLALMGAAPAAWYLVPKMYRRFIAVSAVLAAALFLILSNADFWQRTSTIVDYQTGETRKDETRLHIIGPQFRMFLDHPLGAGHRGNEFLSPRYIPPEYMSNSGRRSAHNTFMAALVDQGFPGAVLLLSLYGWVAIALVRLKRLDAQGLPAHLGIYRAALGAALASCFISGLFLNMLKTEVQIWLVALLAALIAHSKRAIEEVNRSRAAIAAKSDDS